MLRPLGKFDPPRRRPTKTSPPWIKTTVPRMAGINFEPGKEGASDEKSRHQFVTKTELFSGICGTGETRKARELKGFRCCTSKLTRRRSIFRWTPALTQRFSLSVSLSVTKSADRLENLASE